MCIACKQEHFKGSSGRQSSLLVNKDGKLACSKCEKLFVTKATLKRHMQLHTGHYKFYCDVCRKGFSDVTNYNDHKRNHKGLKYHCDYCGKPFVAKKRYQYHLSVHTGKYRFTCNVCGKSFNEKPDFARHVKYHS